MSRRVGGASLTVAVALNYVDVSPVAVFVVNFIAIMYVSRGVASHHL